VSHFSLDLDFEHHRRVGSEILVTRKRESPTAPALPPRGLAWTGDASLCAPWSFAGVPAASLPIGVSSLGLPHAVQLVGAAGDDAKILAVAAWCERVVSFELSPSR